jgi:histidinol-phosphate aminotransferase
VLDPESISDLARDLRGRAVLVVDEAYIEFAGTPGSTRAIGDHDNLTVLRTLSKAFGLAGIRCGALLGPRDLLDRLRHLTPPYPLSLHTASTASRALRPAALRQMARRVEATRRERERLAEHLSTLPGITRVWASRANFLLVEPRVGAGALVEACCDAGVLVRAIEDESTGLDAVRVTVGGVEENQRFCEVIERTAGNSGA